TAPVPAFGLPPADAPFAAAAFRGQPIAAGAATADDALAAALLASKSEASAAQEQARAASLAWERERSAADALTRRVTAEKPYFLVPPVVPFTKHGASSSHHAPPSGSGLRIDPLLGAPSPARPGAGRPRAS